MKKERKSNSQIRADKEKMVMENFASVMKKIDATFLIEGKEEVETPKEEDVEGNSN